MEKNIIIEKLKIAFPTENYDYSNITDSTTNDNVTVICPIHGEFHKRLGRLLKGSGCPKCSGKARKTKDDFIKEANDIHKGKYDYSKTEYKNAHTKICIICPQHGPFYQLPHNHLQGKGCPICNESKLEKEIREELDKNGINYVYQWHLPWNKHFSLDFFIPSINMGIECQGIQHFEDGHFKNISLKEIVERDKYKADSCKKHGIEIILLCYFILYVLLIKMT